MAKIYENERVSSELSRFYCIVARVTLLLYPSVLDNAQVPEASQDRWGVLTQASRLFKAADVFKFANQGSLAFNFLGVMGAGVKSRLWRDRYWSTFNVMRIRGNRIESWSNDLLISDSQATIIADNAPIWSLQNSPLLSCSPNFLWLHQESILKLEICLNKFCRPVFYHRSTLLVNCNLACCTRIWEYLP